MTKNPLHQLMNPKAIATVGAGNNPLKMGTIQALSIIKDGYSGTFYPIHPTEKEVFGFTAYPSAFDLPETPDLVMFVLPAPLVVKILDDFGKIGTRRAIVITAGFRETGAEGRQLEEQLVEVARRHDIRFLGPNCMGIVNSALPLNVTVVPLVASPGLLGVASQSGTYITQTMPYLQHRGIRFSKAISVGNEADIDIIDALEYLGEDDQTKAIALYIEGLKDGNRFLEVARRITPHKPVVAQYVGGSAAGARAGSSHTGAMAGPDHLYDGLLKQAGIIRVYSVEDLYFHGWTLAAQPQLKGKRIAVITNSGGPGTAMAHTCNEGGLEVPTFSTALQEEIRRHIPGHGAAGNPIDLTFHVGNEVISTVLPELIMKSGEVDGIVLHGLMGGGFLKAIYPHFAGLFSGMSVEDFVSQSEKSIPAAVKIPKKYGLPFVLSSFFGREDNYTSTLQDHNIPVFDGPEKAAKAMLALHRYALIRKREMHRPGQLPETSAAAADLIGAARQKGLSSLDEFASKQVLAAYGIPVSTDSLAHSEAEALAAAAAVGYPVVLKGCSTAYSHKTGHGLIHLGLQSAEEVSWAFRAISTAAGQEIAVLVSKMVKGEREMMAGVVRHPGFGPCVMFGLGGILAEVLDDKTFRLAPLSEGDSREMLDSIRAADLIGPYRGLPAADKTALGAILSAIGSLALLHPEIREIDLNPIMISGSDPVVVDALIILAEDGDKSVEN